MKVYIQTDIEGVAGFCFFENRRDPSFENHTHRQRMYQLLTNEVNAAVQAAFDSGASEVIVNDSHGSGYNILFEKLDPRCRIIHGRNGSGATWLNLLDKSFAALVLIGMHAMGGTENSICPHSLWKVNGGKLYLSEGSMAAALAGDLGIPTVFASGDDKIIAELSQKMPDLQSAVVKQALAPHLACSLIPSRACELIAAGVRQGLGLRHGIKPYKIPGPLSLSLLDSNKHCPPLLELQPAIHRDSITQAFFDYEDAMEWTNFNVKLPDGFVFP